MYTVHLDAVDVELSVGVLVKAYQSLILMSHTHTPIYTHAESSIPASVLVL